MITTATWITIGRIILTLPICAAIVMNWDYLAFFLLVIAAVSDFVDGKIARDRGEVTAIGTALDPIADKILVGGMLIALASAGLLSGIHLIAGILIMSREILISGLREAAEGVSDLPVSFLAKIKTTAQFTALGLFLIAPSPFAIVALWLAVGLTLWTGWQYIRLWVQSTKL